MEKGKRALARPQSSTQATTNQPPTTPAQFFVATPVERSSVNVLLPTVTVAYCVPLKVMVTVRSTEKDFETPLLTTLPVPEITRVI